MITHDSTVSDSDDPTSHQQPRYRPVGKRVAVRAVGFSVQDEQKLKQLTALLSDGIDGAPSVSLVVRKSLEVYLLHLLGIQKSDPSRLTHEVSALHVKAKKLCRGKRRQAHHHRHSDDGIQ